MAPGNVGGIHWGGMCYDPERQLLITNISRVAAIIRMLPEGERSASWKEEDAVMRAETGRQNGTPYVMKRDYLFKVDPSRGLIMQTRPPWEHPAGYRPAYGVEEMGGSPWVICWIRCNFPGHSIGDPLILGSDRDGRRAGLCGGEPGRSFAGLTGKLGLSAGNTNCRPGAATPMRAIPRRQAIYPDRCGGHGKLKTLLGDHVVAFSLP